MAYLWENYSEEKKYQIDEKLCPYIEVINQDLLTVYVNPLLRFSELFNASLEGDDEAVFAFDILRKMIGENGENQIINILFHYLAQLDQTKGLDSSQCLMEEIRSEIENGLWGIKIKNLLNILTEEDKDHILYYLSLRCNNENKSFFMDTIGNVFTISSLCYEEKTDLYYLYIGATENDYNLSKLDLIKLLFWPLNKNIKIIWNYHYGIIGCDDTMKIDRIQVV